MSGITITPGTFNPPAALVETPGVVTWPAAASGWQKRRPQQWNSQPVAAVAEAEPSTITLAQYNYVSGVRRFRDSAAPPSAAVITTSGVRYVGDGAYAVSFVDAGLFTCVATPGVYTPAGVVEVGEITIGGGGILRVNIPYLLTLAGTAADVDAAYSVTVQTNAGTFAGGASGNIALDITMLPFPGSTVEATAYPEFTLNLLRNGSIMDSITMAVTVHYIANLVGSGGLHSHSGPVFVDTLFGLAASSAFGTPPAIPFNSYTRSSAGIGSLLFS